MALFNTGYGFIDLRGREHGQRFFSTRGHNVIQSCVRPAGKKTVNNFRPWRSLEAAQARWETLTVDQQDAWDAFADVTQFNDIQGLNSFVDGETYYVAYNTNRRTFNGYLDWIDDPPSLPTWGPRPKFVQFIAKSNDGKIWFTAETAFPGGTRIAAFAKPPSKLAPFLQRVELIWLGTIVLDSGLTAGQQTDAFTSVYRSAFGLASTDRPQGNWFLLWEIQEGYMRTLKDPCVTPSSAVPRSMTCDWLNNHPFAQSWLRASEIRSSNGLKIPVPGYGPTGYTQYSVVNVWPQFVPPGPNSVWRGSWYADDGAGGSFSVGITYPYTNLVTA